MWTPDTRLEHDRNDLRYPSDLTDAEWSILEPLLPSPSKTGRKRGWPMRESGQPAKLTGSLNGCGPGTNGGPDFVARWWSESALQPLLNSDQTLLQPRCLGFAQPLAAPIHNPTCTLQKLGAGIILLQRAGDIADRP